MSARIAVVGSGIAGLSAAWLLNRSHDVTLFEAEPRLGGHTHTVDISLEGQTFPVDTGFLVFNHRTYPELTALFQQLGVETTSSTMSFSVKLNQPAIEWAGGSLRTVFGQPSNLLRPAFWGMLRDILRFNREASVDAALSDRVTLGHYLKARHYSPAFIEWYLLPMAAAIWSCPATQMLEFPLSSFVNFCHNHGLLQVTDRPQWRTVLGGGREYVKKLAAGLPDIRLGCPVSAVRKRGGQIQLTHAGGIDTYDQVVLACHSDQAQALLGNSMPQLDEQLAHLAYQMNYAVLHSDARVLPTRRSLWSAWNYQAGGGTLSERPVTVNYLINQLQPLPVQSPVIVSLNPTQCIDSAAILGEYHYSHPVFTREARQAQQALQALNGREGVWLAGAWMGYGFHEDGLNSAIDVARRLDIEAPWRELARAA